MKPLRPPLKTERTVHEVYDESNLDALLGGFVGAINRLADAIAKPGTSLAEALTRGGSGNNAEVLTAINNLSRKVDTMSSNIDRIEKEAADMAENVGLIRTAVETLNATSEAMKTEIASLKDQVAQGQLDQARLDAAASVFEKADDDIDAIVLSPAPPIEG